MGSAHPPVEQAKKVLTKDQVETFNKNGYHFPVRVMSAADADACREKLEEFEFEHGLIMKTPYRAKPHMVLNWVNDLIRNPQIIDTVEDILGTNLLVWGTSFFIKEPNVPAYVSWHQDSTYWGLSHPDIVTAWVALSPSDVPNGA